MLQLPALTLSVSCSPLLDMSSFLFCRNLCLDTSTHSFLMQPETGFLVAVLSLLMGPEHEPILPQDTQGLPLPLRQTYCRSSLAAAGSSAAAAGLPSSSFFSSSSLASASLSMSSSSSSAPLCETDVWQAVVDMIQALCADEQVLPPLKALQVVCLSSLRVVAACSSFGFSLCSVLCCCLSVFILHDYSCSYYVHSHCTFPYISLSTPFCAATIFGNHRLNWQIKWRSSFIFSHQQRYSQAAAVSSHACETKSATRGLFVCPSGFLSGCHHHQLEFE